MTDYAAGTVAVATVRGVAGVRVLRGIDSTHGPEWVHEEVDGFHTTADGNVTDIRPAVVLDPEHPDVVRFLRYGHAGCGVSEDIADMIRRQIEAQAQPARIPEPGRWGVVEAGYAMRPNEDRCAFVRHLTDEDGGGARWLAQNGGRWSRWDRMTNPVLIREGVK